MDDPGLGVFFENNGRKVQAYIVRMRAFDTLTRWGVKVPEPVLKKEIGASS